MKQNYLRQILSKLQTGIIAKFIAKQLRQPSGFFAKIIGKQMNQSNKILYGLTIKTMNPKDGDSILEIGFGNGKFFKQIFSTAESLKISGIDFSPEMVKTATANNSRDIKSGNLDLQVGSSDKLPFSDNSFDKVFCINVVYFWQQPDNHLQEIYRILKPGGKFYCAIKSKQNLQKMSFTQHGFTLYEEQELVNILQHNELKVVEVNKNTEILEKTEIEAICFVAEK